ncbi:MAG: hypothetical protein UR73_C0006G0005 [candidate division WS6 bacterium GW2011_GWF1_35_23]|uniref:Uncharacterized protein n=1 Tax=candidate division WS6 bacterium GW2011_GWF1_35_23 TaxID=1619097 RepID=A0A0G0FEN9_9BACT|nr:MAG: hypothetical protein UR73_C0006G0005 [candidate division WS6 bacterium GW2011_GWF1_35_23]
MVLLMLVVFPAFDLRANALNAVYLLLSRIEVNVAGTTEKVEMILAIDTGQTIPSGGTVTFYFPDADDTKWCRTAGALTVTAVTSSAVDLATTDWDIDSALPTSGTLTATCTQGSGSGSVDTITISNVGTLTTGTTYGVKLANGTSAGVIGTDDTVGGHDVTIEAKNGTTIDSSTFLISLITNDTVVVSATVAEVPTITCSLSTNTLSLGTIYPGGSFATTSFQITTTTSAYTSGYYWTAYGEGDGSTDAGLYKSTATTDLLASTGSGTLDLRVSGSEGFGMTLSDPDGGDQATVSPDFHNYTFGVFGALDRAPAGAQLILYQSRTQPTSESSTVTFGARAGASAVPGSYQESVTFVCGAYINTTPTEDSGGGGPSEF